MSTIKIIPQYWTNETKYILVHEHGTILVTLFKEPQEDGANAIIHDLYVDNMFRREGIATLLLNKAEEIVKENGYKSATLTFYPKTTPIEVKEWYEQNGYKVVGYYRNEWYSMEKELI